MIIIKSAPYTFAIMWVNSSALLISDQIYRQDINSLSNNSAQIRINLSSAKINYINLYSYIYYIYLKIQI